MRDFMSFDCSPYEEKCVQVSRDTEYMPAMKEEAKRFFHMLERRFPKMREFGMSMRIKTNPHDFGSYLSLDIYYDDENEKAVSYIYFIESNMPATWNDETIPEYGVQA